MRLQAAGIHPANAINVTKTTSNITGSLIDKPNLRHFGRKVALDEDERSQSSTDENNKGLLIHQIKVK